MRWCRRMQGIRRSWLPSAARHRRRSRSGYGESGKLQHAERRSGRDVPAGVVFRIGELFAEDAIPAFIVGANGALAAGAASLASLIRRSYIDRGLRFGLPGTAPDDGTGRLPLGRTDD